MIADRLGSRLRSLWGSVAFRLTLNYGLLGIVTTLALLGFVHLQTIGALHGQVSSQTASRMIYLVAEYELAGRDGVIAAINDSLSKRPELVREIYLYVDRDGNKLAGNLDETSDVPDVNALAAEMRVSREDTEIEARLQNRSMPDGSVLVVGLDLESTHMVRALMGRASLAAVLVALVLVAVGTYIFRQELELRVGAIRRTVARISAGQFKHRIPTSGRNDEFSNLNRDINTMLDRVETLMQGVRYVSDTVAHNLRTPLTRVLGRLRTAQKPGTSPAAVLEATGFAIQEIENLTVMFDKLLQVAEIETGAQRQSFNQVNVGIIAADVIDLYQPLAEENGIRLTLNATESCHVLGDADLLASAIANVVDNGLKYAHSSVYVSVKQVDRRIVICVSDDGIGIPVSKYDQIGTHFFRLNPSMPGYGLGLASVMAVMRLHNGKVVLADARPGLLIALKLPLPRHK